jgi:hypothetical protein
MDPTEQLINVIADASMSLPGGLEQTVAIMVRHNLTIWASDIKRNLDRAAYGISVAKEKPLSEEGRYAIEEALWRIAAAKKSLLAACCVALAVPVIRPGWTKGQPHTVKNSVEFEIDAKLLEQKLVALADEHPAAAELNDLLLRVAEHPAIQLRDAITHSLAPIEDAEGLVFFEIEDIGEARVRGRPINFLWQHGMAQKRDISREALWQDALTAAGEAHAILLEAVVRAADLLAEVGVEERPQRLYRVPATGEIKKRPN